MPIDKTWYLTEVELDKADGYIRPMVAHEGDVGGRGISLSVTDNGRAVNLSGYQVVLDWSVGKVWGNHYFTATNASQGKFEITYPKAMQRPGRASARISIMKGDTFITGSRNFQIEIQSAPVSDEKIEQSEDYSLLGRLIHEVHEATSGVNDAVSSAQSATTAANAAASAANTAADAANEGALAANNAVEGALVAMSDARSAAADASTAADNATVAIENMNKLIPQAQQLIDEGAPIVETAQTAAASATEAASAANAATEAANAAADRANAAADGKVIEFADKATAIAAVRDMYI